MDEIRERNEARRRAQEAERRRLQDEADKRAAVEFARLEKANRELWFRARRRQERWEAFLRFCWKIFAFAALIAVLCWIAVRRAAHLPLFGW
jgi:hypothetical protein